MQTAGHAVLASGVTVAISLLALVVVPVPFLRSMGLGGMLIPLVSVAVVLTLLPALLSSIGPRVDWPRIRHEGVGRPAAGRPGPGSSSGAAGSPPASPLVVLGAAHRAGLRPQDRPGRHRLAGHAAGRRTTPCRPLRARRRRRRRAHPDRGAGPRRAGATPRSPPPAASTASGRPWSAAASDGTTRRRRPPGRTRRSTAPASTSSTTSGPRSRARPTAASASPAPGRSSQDYFRAVYDNFPYVLALIARDHVRAAGADVPVAAAADQGGAAQPGLAGGGLRRRSSSSGRRATAPTRCSASSATGAITFWLPVIIFAFLFGLSMDYEVFILARMREEYDATGEHPRRPWSPGSAAPDGWSPRRR